MDIANRISSLRWLLNEKSCVRVLEAHSGLSGLVVERSEFDAIWESSFTDSASKGLPDIELVTMESRLQTARQILDVTTKPMIIDGDTGGQVEHFPYWIRRMEGLGISAVVIEDKAFPKRNSLDADAVHKLEDVDLFARKIEAGVKARTYPDFMVIARLESLIAKHSMQHALLRAERFVEAGADGIVIHSKAEVSADEVFEFATKFRNVSDKPLVCIPTKYNHIKDEELARAGFNIIIHANHLLRASYRAMSETAECIHACDYSLKLGDAIATVEEIFEITGYRS